MKLTGTLLYSPTTQAQEASDKEKPPTAIRTTYRFSPDKNTYEFGIGRNVFDEDLKLKISDPNTTDPNYLFGFKTNLDIGDIKNTLFITGSTEDEGIGIEIKTNIDNLTINLAADRTADAYHFGGGIDQKLGDTILGIGFDYVNQSDNKESHGLVKIIHAISPEQDIGAAYRFTSGNQDTHSFTAFTSYTGNEVDLGGRAWITSQFTGNDKLIVGEMIVGQNFRKGYTRWAVGREAYDSTLHAENTFENQFAEAPKDMLPWNRIDSGLVGRVKGVYSETNGVESSSLDTSLSYVIPFEENSIVAPIITYGTDFTDNGSFGAGIELQIPFLGGRFQATVISPDLDNADKVEGRLTYSFKF